MGVSQFAALILDFIRVRARVMQMTARNRVPAAGVNDTALSLIIKTSFIRFGRLCVLRVATWTLFLTLFSHLFFPGGRGPACAVDFVYPGFGAHPTASIEENGKPTPNATGGRFLLSLSLSLPTCPVW